MTALAKTEQEVADGALVRHIIKCSTCPSNFDVTDNPKAPYGKKAELELPDGWSSYTIFTPSGPLNLIYCPTCSTTAESEE